MRYEIFNIDSEAQCIRDNSRQISDTENGGDCVCISPIGPTWVRSNHHWPANARRIVALLNLAEAINISTEEIERRVIVHSNLPKMQLPPEAHVEFADDRKHVKCRECGAESAIQCVQNNCHFMES